MTSDLDPEVADDLERRSSSERDPARKGCSYSWTAPVPIKTWPCAMGCGRTVDVSQEEIDAHAAGNARAKTYGFPPLPEALPCPTCKAADARKRDEARAAALLPRQTEITTTDNPDPLAAYKPTPRRLPRGGRKLR